MLKELPIDQVARFTRPFAGKNYNRWPAKLPRRAKGRMDMTYLAHALPWEWACAYIFALDGGHIRAWEQTAAVAGGMGHLGPTPDAFYAAFPRFATALGRAHPKGFAVSRATIPWFSAPNVRQGRRPSHPQILWRSALDFSQNCLARSHPSARLQSACACGIMEVEKYESGGPGMYEGKIKLIEYRGANCGF